METTVKNENFEVEQRIANFIRAFTGLMKCHNMNMGIDLKKKELVVQDKETLKIASIDLGILNNLIDDNDRNNTVEMPVARELINISRNTVPYLNNYEADIIMTTLLGALTRMEKEINKDDLHNILK